MQEAGQTSSYPYFVLPVNRPVVRFGQQELCELRSADQTLELRTEDVEAVVSVCNEELVYNRLFRERLNGEPYSQSHAQGYLAWAREGWQRNEWFVFLVRNAQNRIIGAIDIKSATKDEAEIGYWASSRSPGLMTNTVIQLCQVAKEAGYRRLFALIEPDNEQSVRVVLRAHFVQEGDALRNNRRLLQFAKML